MAQVKTKIPPDKFAIAAALKEIGTLLELKGGESRFKARAYERGARAIVGLSRDIGELIQQEQLTSLPGIGNALASQIKQLYNTGSASVLRNLRQEFPLGIVELSGVPGLSVSKIRALHDALGISSMAELKAACEAGRVREVKGFGLKTEQRLLETLVNQSEHTQKNKRIHIHDALRAAEQIVTYLRAARELRQVSFAGALRRWKETVGTIRIVGSSKQPALVVERFLQFPLIVKLEDRTESSCTVQLADGARVSLELVRPNDFPLALLWKTGSESHLRKLRDVASHKKLKLSEQSLQGQIAHGDALKSKRGLPLRSEADVYQRLGMQYIPPELREDQGEIEAALAGKLPEDLVTLDDIQGMVHCHTIYSDGKNTIAEMARAAEAMGMKYLTITDHSPTAFYAGGVTLDRLTRQWDEIDEAQDKIRVKLLKGTESDILADGSLDYPDSILEKFDLIVASIHSRYKMDSEKMTKRLLTAMRQPVFKIWGHALGRLIQRRPPFDCDVEKILDAISESRAAIEINGDPYRLDMEPRWIREARKRKIKFVISVDAHSTGAMNNLKFGVGTARRGWVRRPEVLNTLGSKAFVKSVRPVS